MLANDAEIGDARGGAAVFESLWQDAGGCIFVTSEPHIQESKRLLAELSNRILQGGRQSSLSVLPSVFKLSFFGLPLWAA